jgi:molybdopterin adenylyltransferase
MNMTTNEELLIGLLSISDRAAQGVYEDQGIPALQEWFGAALSSPWRSATRLIADDQASIERTLIELVDELGCHLVLTTGGTGPAPRDVTPEATLAVADKVLPGFGEEMRRISLNFVPTAILSRQLGRGARQGLDPQPSRAAEVDPRNARGGKSRRRQVGRQRHFRCRTVLSRPDRWSLRRDC